MRNIRRPSLAALLALALAACGSAPERPPLQAGALPSAAGREDDRGMYLALIARMQDEGAYYASLAHVDAYRQRYGESPDLLVLEADALRETGRADAAEALYRKLAGGPRAAAAWHGLGLVAARRQRHAEAEEALAKAVRLAPLNVSYLGDLGFARMRAGRLDAAQAPLAQAAELAPGNARAVANLVLWTLLSGDAVRAHAMMRQADLSDAARAEIHRLAAEMRPRPGEAAAAPATGGARATGRALPPQPMLERFNLANAASETSP